MSSHWRFNRFVESYEGCETSEKCVFFCCTTNILCYLCINILKYTRHHQCCTTIQYLCDIVVYFQLCFSTFIGTERKREWKKSWSETKWNVIKMNMQHPNEDGLCFTIYDCFSPEITSWHIFTRQTHTGSLYERNFNYIRTDCKCVCWTPSNRYFYFSLNFFVCISSFK